MHSFKPDVILLALDAHHLAEAENADAEGILAMLRSCWNAARESLGCSVIQQTVLPVHPSFAWQPGVAVSCVSCRDRDQGQRLLREQAPKANVHLADRGYVGRGEWNFRVVRARAVVPLQAGNSSHGFPTFMGIK